MKKIIQLIQIIFLFIYLPNSVVLASPSSKIDSTSFEKATKGIVTIDTRISVSAYKQVGSWKGTGFIADKKQGLIVTNNHLVGSASIGSYFVTFFNGQQSEAKVLYYDLWQDYAILKIDPKNIPPAAEEVVFSKEFPKQNQEVLVVGNNEVKDFSFHTGRISNLYDINGEMPQASFIINLNAAGGASGSPILNDKNQAIGVLYGVGQTYAIALHGSYVLRTLEALKANKLPKRRHIGAIADIYSLDKAVKHRNFPKAEMDKYLQNFPDARNRAISIYSIIAGSPAALILQPGDIIWEANGTPIRGNLAVLDEAMDKSNEPAINLLIYRDGKPLTLQVPLYDIESYKVQRMINFGGAIFFETDDYASAKSGTPLGSLTVANVQTSTSFSALPVSFMEGDKTYYRIHMRSINEKSVKNINDLIRIIPEIVDHKFISIKYKNYQPYFFPYQGNLVSSQDEMIADITLDTIDLKPRTLRYDSNTLDWVTEEITGQHSN
jgi:S1-C subfamily serine protease